MSTLLTRAVSAHDHIQGRSDAPATLVEYGDYECPHCARAYHVIKAVQRHLGAALRFVYRNFPLHELHPHAELAAEGAEAAAAQGQFWEMHDILFERQSALAPLHLVRLAEQLGLDTARFADELETRAYRQRVRDDFTSGVFSGVNGTPTFFINGRRHDGAYDERSLITALEGTLRNQHA